MPAFPVPDGFSSEAEFLNHLVFENAKYGESIPNEVRERLEFELNTIK